MDHLSRRSFVGKGLGVCGAAVIAGVASACGSSSKSSTATTSTTIPPNTPDEALKLLLDGNARFVGGTVQQPRRDDVRRAEQAEHQMPFAVVLGCSDSRVPPEIVFDEGIGDLFPVRVAGNTADDAIVLGSIEYGVAVLKCLLVVVLGHEGCGAVKATIDQVVNGNTPPGQIEAVLKPIIPAVEAARSQNPPDLLHASMLENVRRQAAQLRSSEALLSDPVQSGQLKVVGAEYDLTSGKVDIVE